MNLQMKPMDYEFNIGDEVITIHGEKGYITYICHCEKCANRGFFEPSWCDEDEDMHYISNHEAENGFTGYYKIGKYHFNSFEKDWAKGRIAYHRGLINRLKRQLSVINEIEKE